MFPASTYKGGAVVAFPDVCKTPGPPAPQVPAPYPNIGAKQTGKAGKASKAVIGAKKSVASKNASQQDLHKTLDDLHGTIKSMRTQDANAWHEAVDKYVMAVAAVYMSGKNSARLG